MMRSLYSGVSGLNNHQVRMDVIGNNISNVNTTGFKKGRVNFQDILSQTIAEAARPEETRGGINPKQVGLGMSVATIDTIHTQGSLQTTGNNTDIAIMGDGFLVQRFAEEVFYTRNGVLGLDAKGVLVNPSNGFEVLGYGAVSASAGEYVIDRLSGLQKILIPKGLKDPATATQIIKYKSNLNSLLPVIRDPANLEELQNGTWTTTVRAYDSQGGEQEVRLSFVRQQDADGNPLPNLWRSDVQVTDIKGRVVQNIAVGGGDNQFSMLFNNLGAIQGVGPGLQGQIPPAAQGTTLSLNLTYNIAGQEQSNIQLDFGKAGLFDGVTQFASPNSTKAYFQDGKSMGYLQGFMINDAGIVLGAFTNGTERPMGQIALAMFTNPGGLSKEGDSYYVQTQNSGLPTVTVPAQEGAGKLKPGMLEMSNVDLTSEFTDMIITQRGFQANSRSITTSDSMLEEILRLKR